MSGLACEDLQDGLALQFAARESRADREVVLTAVSQNGWSLQYVSDELKGQSCNFRSSRQSLTSESPQESISTLGTCHFSSIWVQNMINKIKQWFSNCLYLPQPNDLQVLGAFCLGVRAKKKVSSFQDFELCMWLERLT